MADSSRWVKVGKHKLELSNLEKILFPEDHISKAEFIQYYHAVSPTLLYHIKGRPLTLIRYPDGIDRQRFYQKNKPEWAPAWIESVSLGGDKKKDYITVSEQASLIWLANLASVELHQMHSRRPRFDRPDYMAFDLDPPEDSDFRQVTETAFLLKKHIEGYGYHTFVKTTGGKGLHLIVPLEPDHDQAEVFQASRAIAAAFVAEHKKETTLEMKKDARKGRILIDIYRNRSSQTIVSPYSLRGKPGAPVSMPLSWDELAEIESSAEYHLGNAGDKVKSDGDAWEGIGSYAAGLHTRRTAPKKSQSLPESPRRKTPGQLTEYGRKRDFSKSPEPDEDTGPSQANQFVIHRHHATRLHYDLRLEREGVLRSWAVPKGLPPRPGVKRLAVQTEDHPVEYLGFEGTIPKEEYGGGDMWIFARGRYEITGEKKNGFYFRLDSAGVSGEYRMHKMKGQEWLLEKVEVPQRDWLNEPVEPMHGESADNPPKGDYYYEVKWDGIRALITLEDGQIRIRSRNQNDITGKFPELQASAKSFNAACGLFDGEIVSLDESGKPSFQAVIHRLQSTGETAIQRLSRTKPVHCYVFDCLYLDGRALVGEPLARRYEWLADVMKRGMRFRLSEMMEDGEALFRAAREHNLEGIMAKKRGGTYLTGKRSDLWLKVKVRHTTECFVVGYTRGRSERSGTFGALHLAEKEFAEKTGEAWSQNGKQQKGHEKFRYRGKVGTGFTGETMERVYGELKRLKPVPKPAYEHVVSDRGTVWVEPELMVEVAYSRLSDNGLFMEAVFIRMRPDLSI